MPRRSIRPLSLPPREVADDRQPAAWVRHCAASADAWVRALAVRQDCGWKWVVAAAEPRLYSPMEPAERAFRPTAMTHLLSNTADRPLRIGAVSYLNTKPLVHGLGEAIAGHAELSFAVPSVLSRRLSSGELDIALAPVIELLRNPSWTVVSDACIACRGPVWSVQTLFRTEPRRVRTLAVDEGSRTSAALTQILLYERYGVLPEVRTLPLASSVLDCDADAALVIGDRAMHLHRLPEAFLARWDLGEEWFAATGLPFVFAAWIGRQAPDSDALTDLLQRRRDEGLQRAGELATEYAPQHELTAAEVEHYFLHHLAFRMGAEERRGMELFLAKAAALGLDRSLVIPREVEAAGR